MKKTIFATLALGTALTFGGLEHKANASEIDYNTLAEKAKSNSTELVQHPIQEGNYDFSFVEDGYTFHFYNYNGNFGYDYHQSTDGQVENTSSKLASQEQATPEQKIDQQQSQFDKQNKLDKKEQAPVDNTTKQPTQSTSSKVKLSNGNTPGKVGSSVAQQMAERTGVSASTWETIIAKESNGNPNAHNPSGANGILQTMPSWGDTSTVQGQIDAATKAYKAQGLSAWGM
jgi:hypothetical protein